MAKYTLEVTHNDGKGLSISSNNEGFTPMELYGLLAWKMADIRDQMLGFITPDVVKRTVVDERQPQKG